MKPMLKIAVAEPSLIIRNGIVAVLRRLPSLHVEVAEIVDTAQLQALLSRRKTDILIANPVLFGTFSLPSLRREADDLKCVALQNMLADAAMLKDFDEVISVYDSAEMIREKIEKLSARKEDSLLREPLTDREKEIIIGVVKGLTNKQMAEQFCLSTHTVITHRRNIAQKLQIHSAAGLTIYAIVNKFVDLEDVKSTIHRKENE